VLGLGPADIDKELARRFAAAYTKGRYWPMLDHGITPVPWENWVYFAKRYKDYCSSSLSKLSHFLGGQRP
jgi:hypothetical protein